MAWIAGLLAAVLAVGGVLWWRTRPRPPQPPEVPAAITDPDARAAVTAARDEVLAHPGAGHAWGRLGMVLLAHGRMDQTADDCFARAETLSPNEARWPYYRWMLARMADRPTDQEFLRRAAGLASPTSEGGRAVRMRWAETLLAQGELDGAERLFAEQVAVTPDDPQAAYGLGLVALARGDPARGLPYLTTAAKSPFARKRGTSYLAAAHRRLGHADEADRLEREVRTLPDDPGWLDSYLSDYQELARGPDAIFTEATTLRGQGRVADAVARVRDYVDRHTTAENRIRAGTFLAETGDLAAAEEQFRACLRLDPDHPDAHHYLTLTLVLKAEQAERSANPAAAEAGYREAIDHARRCLAKKQDDAPVAAYLGRALIGTGQPAEAVAPLRRALALKPDLADAHLWLIEALLKTGATADAAAAARAAAGVAGVDPAKLKNLRERIGK